MMRLSRLVPMVAMVVPASAWATSEAEAEHIRLAEEMRKLAARNAWRGVEAKYTGMLELEKKGVQITVEDHLLGVQAARQLGSVYDVFLRLTAANTLEPSDELAGQIAAIEASYGLVKLDVDDKFKEDFGFKPDRMPLDPSKRKAIEVAQKKVAEGRKFIGMLPVGRYTLATQSFDVSPGVEDRLEVYIGPVRRNKNKGAKKDEGNMAVREREGFRVDVGPQFTRMGGTTVDDSGGTVSASADIAASASLGGRAGLGYEFFLKKGWSFMIEGGWHGGFAGSTDGSTSPDLNVAVQDPASKGIQSVYGWAAPTWYYDDLAITIGPTYSYVRAQAVSVDPDVDGAFTGNLTCGGATASIFYGLFDTPGIANSRSGFSAAAGVFVSKSMMTFPWAQVAFTIAPEG